MSPKEQHQYIAWGILSSLLLLHWLWCQYVAYPISFEKQLKKGKPWVYIPLKWKGMRKFQVRLISRLLIVGLVAAGILLIKLYSGKSSGPLYLAFGIAMGFVAIRLDSFWLQIRYRQQEDSYYHLHDELRAKLEGEGRDMGESAFKNLAAYQHQNLLRKADQQGMLIKTLGDQARISRKHRKDAPSRQVVET